MGKRSAVVELFLGDMGSIQRELRPSTQREDQLTMETKLEQIAVKAVNQLPKSVVREIRTPRSVGAGGGRPPPATRWARRNPRPYRDHRADGEMRNIHRDQSHKDPRKSLLRPPGSLRSANSARNGVHYLALASLNTWPAAQTGNCAKLHYR